MSNCYPVDLFGFLAGVNLTRMQTSIQGNSDSPIYGNFSKLLQSRIRKLISGSK